MIGQRVAIDKAHGPDAFSRYDLGFQVTIQDIPTDKSKQNTINIRQYIFWNDPSRSQLRTYPFTYQVAIGSLKTLGPNEVENAYEPELEGHGNQMIVPYYIQTMLGKNVKEQSFAIQ